MTANPLDCEIGTVRAGEPLVVTVRGEVDLATAPELASCVRSVLGRASASVVLDVAAIAFIDSSGLRELVTLSEEARSRDISLVLRNVPRHMERVLELTGLTERFLPPAAG